MTIHNFGDSDARDLAFSDSQPYFTTFGPTIVTSPALRPWDIALQDGTLSVQIDLLPANRTQVIQFDVIADSVIPQGVSVIANQGYVSGNTLSLSISCFDYYSV